MIDIIITGEVCPLTMQYMDISDQRQTDHERGLAWGAFKYIGRMRPSDGLVVLLREPVRAFPLIPPWIPTG